MEQTDLLIREGAHLVAPDLNVADRHVVLQQGNTEDGPDSALARQRTTFRELVDLGLQVLDVNQAPLDHSATGERPAVQRDIAGGQRAMMSDQAQHVSIDAQHDDIERPA